MLIAINDNWQITSDERQWVAQYRATASSAWNSFYFYTDSTWVAESLLNPVNDIQKFELDAWITVGTALATAIAAIAQCIAENYSITHQQFQGSVLTLPSGRNIESDGLNFSVGYAHKSRKYHATIRQAIIKDFYRMVLARNDEGVERCLTAIEYLRDQYLNWITTNLMQLEGTA